MNNCMIIGNLVRDPETIRTQAGVTICRYTVAVSRTYKDTNGERGTDYIPVSAWYRLGDLCAKYLHKGSRVAVTGEIQVRTYEDKQKVRRMGFEIVANDVEFLTPKPTAEPHAVAAGGAA